MIEAVVCYIKKDGKYLFIHNKKRDRLNGPGGAREVSETPKEAVIREVKEETGLTVLTPRFKGYIHMPATSNYELRRG